MTTPTLPKKVATRREHTGEVAQDRAQRLAQQVVSAHEQTKAVVSNHETRVTALEVFGPNQRWSPANEGASLAVAATAGNFTTGVQFSVGRACTCTGLKFYGVAAAAKSVKCKLYNAAGTLLTSAIVTISANGTYTVTWATPIVLTPFALYRVATYQLDGLNYYAFVAASANAPARPFYAGGTVVLNNIALFLAGDSAPTTTAAAEAYPVEPTLV